MSQSSRHKRQQKLKRRLERHWGRVLYSQLVAYVLVLVLWLLPIPNPVKLLAVIFHELSHCIAAVVSGGRVFGFAIVPEGAGVTMGIGGNMPLILAAGYIGSCLWGAALYYVSCKWDSKYALMSLVALIFGSAFLGWATSQTAFFGIGSLVIMFVLFKTPEAFQVFFVRLVGSACCLYAPLEIVGEVVKSGGAPSVLGQATPSDVVQLSQISGIPAALIGLVILGVQIAILVSLVRWTCDAGAKQIVRRENAERREIKQLLDDIRPERRRYTLR